jgi:WD40 repeat protein
LATVTIQQSGGPRDAARFQWVTAVWDLKNKGRPVGAPLRQDRPVTRVALSPDGQRLIAYSPAPPAPSLAIFGVATPGPEGKACLCEVRTGRRIVLTHAAAITHAAFSPDGRLVVTASADHTARVWEAATGKPVSPALEHQGPVNSAAFGPGGLVVTAGNDNTARIWDLATREMIAPPLPHHDWVLAASFDSTGRRLVTAGCDGTARVWDLALPRPADSHLPGFVQLLAGRQIDGAGGLTALDGKLLCQYWEKLHRDYPTAFTSSPATVSVWHREEADGAENKAD